MKLVVLICVTLVSSLLAEKKAIQGPQAAPAFNFETDKHGKRQNIDFGISPKAISHESLKFGDFASKNLLIFYFSAKCPHCQDALPHVQKLAGELQGSGFEAVAIAIKNNSEEDIREFIREYKCQLPVFHDSKRKFGNSYGTGSIPLLVLVNGEGEYIRYKSFDEKKTPESVKVAASKMVASNH